MSKRIGLYISCDVKDCKNFVRDSAPGGSVPVFFDDALRSLGWKIVRTDSKNLRYCPSCRKQIEGGEG